MLFCFNQRREKDYYQNYHEVDKWPPSRRPQFKSLLTGQIVRLDKVTSSEVQYTKSCGATRRQRLGAFLKEFKRIS